MPDGLYGGAFGASHGALAMLGFEFARRDDGPGAWRLHSAEHRLVSGWSSPWRGRFPTEIFGPLSI